MLRSLYSGVSGLRGFQTKLDVIGNNIANVNTPGFKASRIMFQDILSQSIGGATGPTAGRGGTNPMQVGLGSTIGSIDTLHTQGSWMTTNVPSDAAIDGDGFFIVQDENGQRFLTRAGNFYTDAARNLVTSGGLRVIGMDGEPIQLGNPADADMKIERFEIGRDGTITVTYADGSTLDPAPQIALAKIDNPGGLQKVGNSLYVPTPNADGIITDNDALMDPDNFSSPGTDGTGNLITNVLEMSNTDLTSEFTEMIVAQRAFQANSRIITTSDEVLQELVNLKR